MKEILVKTSKPYKIYIDHGVIDQISDLVGVDRARRFVVLTDKNVDKLHFMTLARALSKTKSDVFKFVIEPGEDSKSFDNLISLLEFMADKDINSKDMLIAFGGGVVGDLGGFAAAIYRRGIDYIQVPTTLLAQVDSSVGGKTAINLSRAKNMVGSFNQPRAVFCDRQFLHTLADDEFACGMGEVIKYGILFDRDLFLNLMDRERLDEKMEPIIARCISLKRDIVEEDEFDTGKRQLLNLGHSLAHAIEVLSKHTIKHGQAVAIGTYTVALASFKRGLLPSEDLELIKEAITANNLPLEVPYKLTDMMEIIRKDKKRRGDYINEILIKKIGDTYLEEFDFDGLEEFLGEAYDKN
ncbi:MAG: 3-dehydroquinate synthase [Anaerococcus sp.]|nr:3-dehydroquinate synthase [Anaerococcus sp.]